MNGTNLLYKDTIVRRAFDRQCSGLCFLYQGLPEVEIQGGLIDSVPRHLIVSVISSFLFESESTVRLKLISIQLTFQIVFLFSGGFLWCFRFLAIKIIVGTYHCTYNYDLLI